MRGFPCRAASQPHQHPLHTSFYLVPGQGTPETHNKSIGMAGPGYSELVAHEAACLTSWTGQRRHRGGRAADEGERQRAVKVRRSPRARNSHAPACTLAAPLWHTPWPARHHHRCRDRPRVRPCMQHSRAPPPAPQQARRMPRKAQAQPPRAALFAQQGGVANAHRGRALVDGRPGTGALHRMPELDAPFPDGWAPPFPIGFAFLCPSLQSRHSH